MDNIKKIELTKEDALERALEGMKKLDNVKKIITIMYLVENEVKKQEDGY